MFPAVFAPLAIFFAFALRLLFPPGVFTGPESSPPGLLASAVSSSGAREKTLASAPPAAGLPDWVQIDYSALVDRRRLSHSGESIGTLLKALEGRPVPPPGERPADLKAHMLLDPLLEPYAFVLPDALDSLLSAPQPPMVEVGGLWQPGETQPAWAELLRSRHFLVESNGEGRLRLFLPLRPEQFQQPPAAPRGTSDPSQQLTSPAGPARSLPSSTAAAEQAWKSAWPVLRHIFAAEKRRLARQASNRHEDHPLDVEAHAYAHLPASSMFLLGMQPFRKQVMDTKPAEERITLDLAALQSFLDREIGRAHV